MLSQTSWAAGSRVWWNIFWGVKYGYHVMWNLNGATQLLFENGTRKLQGEYYMDFPEVKCRMKVPFQRVWRGQVKTRLGCKDFHLSTSPLWHDMIKTFAPQWPRSQRRGDMMITIALRTRFKLKGRNTGIAKLRRLPPSRRGHLTSFTVSLTCTRKRTHGTH